MVLSYELILGATRVSKGGQKCKRSVESSSTLPRPFPAVRQRLRRAFFFFLYRQHYGKTAVLLASPSAGIEARPPYIRRLRTEDARLAGAAQDGMLGTERIQGNHASALRCPDGRQPGSQ